MAPQIKYAAGDNEIIIAGIFLGNIQSTERNSRKTLGCLVYHCRGNINSAVGKFQAPGQLPCIEISHSASHIQD